MHLIIIRSSSSIGMTEVMIVAMFIPPVFVCIIGRIALIIAVSLIISMVPY